MSSQESERLDDAFLASWDHQSVDEAVAIMSDDVVWYDVTAPEPMRGKAATRPYLQGWFTAFPDMKSFAKNRVVCDDQVATEVEFTGTNRGPMQLSAASPAIPPTGRQIRGNGAYFLRVRDGKVVEIHTYPNVMGIMAQLGLMG
jgi:steroid delta-isomerase-like uncharacterized protein